MSLTVTDLSLDRGLPASPEAERYILGAILLDNNLQDEALSTLKPEHFFLDAHRRIYQRIAELSENNRPIDIVTLIEELLRHKELESVGGAYYLASLTDGVPRRSSLEQYIRIVRDKAKLRNLIHASNSVIYQALRQTSTASEVIDAAESRIFNIENVFHSCFISYSTKDQDFAEKLYLDLRAERVPCWFAPHDMEPGKKIHEQIDQAIHLHERLLLILSPHSINSEWVKTEIKKARNREVAENRHILFPIRLTSIEALRKWEYRDPDTGGDIATEIREYHIPDFTKWKKNQNLYQKEFKKLLKSLQSAGAAPDGQSKANL